MRKRLVVVPTDPLAVYEMKGITSRLQAYYNPCGMFDEVFCLSPFEWERRTAFGMTVEPCNIVTFKDKVAELAPSVVRVYGGGTACEVAVTARNLGIPIVASIHDIQPQFMKKAVIHADHLLAVSAAVGRALMAMKVPAHRISYLPNRIDVDKFSPAPKPAAALRNGRYEVLHLGRKSPQKNLDNVIRAMASLPANYILTAAGPGDSTAYEQLATALGVANRVRFVSMIPNHELPEILRNAACLCNPSRWEGFGVIFLEALACGAPVVARDCAPATELIVDGVSGVLVGEAENPNHIAAAIRRACEDETLRRRCHGSGPRIAQRYSLATQSRVEANIYQRIMSEHEQRKAS